MASETSGPDVPGIDRTPLKGLTAREGPLGRHDPVSVAVAAAAVAVLVSLGRRLAVNSPVDIPGLVAVGSAVEGTAAVVTAIAALLAGFAARDRHAIVGLVSVGILATFAVVG